MRERQTCWVREVEVDDADDDLLVLSQVLADQVLQHPPVGGIDLGHVVDDFFHDLILPPFFRRLQPVWPMGLERKAGCKA